MKFPSGFLIGAATSAHQVEGGNISNDWWRWEQQVASTASGRASDHWNRYKEDFALAKTLGHTAHRFSIEWSRIEPKPGVFDPKAIAHYRDVLLELRRLDIKSFVTLHHFTNPTWLADKGGWESGYAVERFESYTRYVAQHLGELVDMWVTINEPVVYATQSYWQKKWPPQKRTAYGVLKVISNMAKAHRLAYRILHSISPNVPVGFAKHLIAYMPETAQRWDARLLVDVENWWFNHRFFSLTHGAYDFIGVNYYFPAKFRIGFFPPRLEPVTWNGPTTDVGWPIEPKGLLHVLQEMKRYKKPVYITENGIADAHDTKRADFIRSHMRSVKQAISEGIDVRGYLHWSLIDNFEWAEGFSPRFGLIEVDYATMKRTIRSSAYVLKAFRDTQ